MSRQACGLFLNGGRAATEASTPPAPKRKRGKVIVFGWYGGKFNHLDWLLPLLPQCHHYCEPFGGSAAVLFNRKPSPVHHEKACRAFRSLLALA